MELLVVSSSLSIDVHLNESLHEVVLAGLVENEDVFVQVLNPLPVRVSLVLVLVLLLGNDLGHEVHHCHSQVWVPHSFVQDYTNTCRNLSVNLNSSPHVALGVHLFHQVGIFRQVFHEADRQARHVNRQFILLGNRQLQS